MVSISSGSIETPGDLGSPWYHMAPGASGKQDWHEISAWTRDANLA